MNYEIKPWYIKYSLCQFYQNMKINDVRCLVIPPKLAYGNRKMGNIRRYEGNRRV